jgi:hypothetical protein
MGIWVSRKEAVIVTLANGSVETRKLTSEVEKRVRFSGASHAAESSVGARDAWAEDRRDRRFEQQVARFYAEIITHLRGADALLIFGPGESKIELKKRLADEGLVAEVVAVKATDKMTERQIAAYVREHFQKQRQPTA